MTNKQNDELLAFDEKSKRSTRIGLGLLLLAIVLGVFLYGAVSGLIYYPILAILLLVSSILMFGDKYERRALAFKIRCEEKGLTYKPGFSSARPTPRNPLDKIFLIGVSEKDNTILIKTDTADDTDTDMLINVNEIIGVELSLNSNSVYQAGSIMSLAAAAVGGLTFGGAGAIVGSLTAGRKGVGKISELVLNLRMDSIDKPLEKIYFISKPAKASSAEAELKLAEKWTNLIEVMRYRLANSDKSTAN